MNIPFRIKHYEGRGYVAEIKKGFFWTHFISVSGMSDQPWYFSSYNIAADELLKEIQYELIRQAR